ncbi:MULTISPECIES: glycosyltransferase family 4 protein [Chromobacterium]|nr:MULTISPECIES: glycosyltransferase family 1 protein [Chromobacterium]QOZ81938.1 glycosyltransferase family 1 protein [Chromobacterium sp. Rain0013]WON81938.1 glycosyltransferase family 4 protein [Chromobacterium haemolyticum]
MRIGIDYRPVTAAPRSGIARQVLALEAALAARPNVEVLRFTACPADHPHRRLAECPARPSPTDGLHRPRERWHFECRFLPRAIRARRLDLYIATANTGLPLWRAPGGVRYAMLLHDVFQLTLDNYHVSLLRALAYRVIDWIGTARSLQRADAIWTPSQFTADAAARLFPRQRAKLALLPNAVPQPAAPAAALPASLPARYWLAVGAREPRKNMPWFVEQWRKARQRQPDLPALALVARPEDLPAELRRLEGLIWLSDLDDGMLSAVYAAAERLWQPSYAEGFGLPVIEALAQGTPVAVATGSALDEVAPPQAARFAPNDASGLQALMHRLAAAGPDGDADANRAWARRYDMDAYRRRVDQLLDRLLA